MYIWTQQDNGSANSKESNLTPNPNVPPRELPAGANAKHELNPRQGAWSEDLQRCPPSEGEDSIQSHINDSVCAFVRKCLWQTPGKSSTFGSVPPRPLATSKYYFREELNGLLIILFNIWSMTIRDCVIRLLVLFRRCVPRTIFYIILERHAVVVHVVFGFCQILRLIEFWNWEGSHYRMCIPPKINAIC